VSRRPATLLLLLAVGLTAAACGSSGSATAPSSPTVDVPARGVTLWVDVPLAGAAAQDGRQMLDAVRLVVEQAGGRVGTLAVRVRASDDADPTTGRSDPIRCLAGASRAVADPTAVAVIGTYESSCTLAALPPLEAAGLAIVSPVNSAPALVAADGTGTRVLVRLAPADALQGAAAAGEVRSLGLHRLFVLTGRSSRARGQLAALLAAVPASAAAVVGSAPAPLTTTTVTALLGRIRAARADAIWLGGEPGPGAVALLRALAAAARRPHAADAPVVIGTDALYRDGLVRAAGVAAEGLRVTSAFLPPDALDGAGAGFADAFARQYGEPGPYAAYAADAARLVLATLHRSNATRAGVLRALFRTRAYRGLVGTLGIAADGGSTLARIAVLRVHKGQFRLERVVELGPG
jgi:branched-chain amino acid transport system substrate-binding protein